MENLARFLCFPKYYENNKTKLPLPMCTDPNLPSENITIVQPLTMFCLCVTHLFFIPVIAKDIHRIFSWGGGGRHNFNDTHERLEGP